MTQGGSKARGENNVKDYLLVLCEESYRCNPDTIGMELWIAGVIVTILVVAAIIKRIRK